MKTLFRTLVLAGVVVIAYGSTKATQPVLDGPFPPPCLPPQVCTR